MDRKHDKPKGKDPKDELDKELEEGLEETFPASDAPTATQPVHEPHPKKR